MGLNNAFIRWWVTFVVVTCPIVTALLAGIGKFIYNSDVTFLSWLIMILYVIASIRIGFVARQINQDPYGFYASIDEKKSSFNVVRYFANTCTTLGLLGTIIGLIVSMLGAFQSLDLTNQVSIQSGLTTIALGIGTALITTMVGLIASALLHLQMVVVKGEDYHE